MSNLNVRGIVCHITSSSFGDVPTVRKWHTDPPPQGRGWSDIGYHCLIMNGFRQAHDPYSVDLDGHISAGRPENIQGAHCLAHGMNTATLGVCCVAEPGEDGRKGLFKHPHPAEAKYLQFADRPHVSARQVDALVHWLAVKCHQYHLDPLGKIEVQGRKVPTISQHSDHDSGKPYCASLNMDEIRAATHAQMIREGLLPAPQATVHKEQVLDDHDTQPVQDVQPPAPAATPEPVESTPKKSSASTDK